MTWALLTPKHTTKDSIVKKIVIGALYVKPSSRKNSATLDHIAEVYNMLKAKYVKGLFWVLAGDTNDLKLGPILRLSSKLKSVVKKPTRLNPKNPQKSSILDNIITDMHKWYQNPECLPPISADKGQGKPSDHLTVIFEPISVINNLPLRRKRNITSRPITESGLNMFSMWLEEQNWECIENTHSVNAQTNLLLKTLTDQVNSFFPLKSSTHTTDDSPWCNDKVKRIKIIKCREYRKHRMSKKWADLDLKYKSVLGEAKEKYYTNIVKDLKISKPSQWYSKLKRMCSYDQEKYEPIICDEISELTDIEQAEQIAEHFVKPRNRYDALRKCDINFPSFDEATIPQFSQKQVEKALKELDTKKSVPPGDIPTVIFKKFSGNLSSPVTNMLNSAIKQGVWPDIFKTEYVTPVPKVYPPRKLQNLRSISGLMTLDKVFEK